ncbi:MAG: glutamine--fructose-6-phosphate transaminase (isomerizing) [Alphaproteobacteria bacterium]|nr:glutamine--fructose-6-phosphate transaminase (isomerizing) [Alphaproteobacteria bacterium]MBF0129864.1 glutamine--fructose-6-phosphate transaminase (isomerizing) [Alphaproteobacteria bacterium]
MCGIVGIVGKAEAAPLLIEGLHRLEYRGYDSAGIATLVDGRIERRRAEGKIANLEALLKRSPIEGRTGIGHTRWATHGVPNETNAHPHANGSVAVVHNGIIENFAELRSELTREGHVFESQTDTEVVVHLLTRFLRQGLSPEESVQSALRKLQGAFALGILFAGRHDLLIGARRGSPLAIGYGDGEMFLGSDALALAPLTQRIAYLEEGDWAVLSPEGASVRDADGREVRREIRLTALSGAMIGKGEFRHFMLKEIFEQPQVIGDTLNAMFNPVSRTISLPPLPFELGEVRRATIIACGTSYYAGLVAKYWLEQVARVPVEVDVASEFRYREPPMEPGGLALFISQSGETADTLAALRYCKSKGQHILSVVNVPESTIARESDAVLPTLAGPEIGVASTKGFTTQLTVLACLALALARARGAIDHPTEARLSSAIAEVPRRAAEVLNHDGRIREIALTVAEARDVLYMGRGSSYPVALEGALKLKEISYIHAEGYAAGEMKHGPIALIDESVPVIVIAPSDDLFEKTASNVQEVVARGGKVVAFGDGPGVSRMADSAVFTVTLPYVDPFVTPILYSIPVQLLAYHVAVLKGTDVDQPRNLAKSVTVE